MTERRVMAEPVTDRLVSAVAAPTVEPKVTVPLPALTVSALAPETAAPRLMLPLVLLLLKLLSVASSTTVLRVSAPPVITSPVMTT